MSNVGLELAKIAELPPHVLEVAKTVAYQLDSKQHHGVSQSCPSYLHSTHYYWQCLLVHAAKYSSESVLTITRRRILVNVSAIDTHSDW